MATNGKLELMYISTLGNKKIKMKNNIKSYLKIVLFLGFVFTINSNCERAISDEVEFATASTNGAVFIDGFTGDLDYLPFAGSKLNAFTVDTEVKYKGEASMRLDVPNVGDPQGAFAGAIFPVTPGRDLTQFDALTFWAKGSQAGTINEIGFGNDFGENKFLVTKQNLRINTTWQKYTIPLPDPDKLKLERGAFWYAEGPEDNDGYTFWIDDLQYEKLGTLAQPRPAMLNGVDVNQQSFVGTTILLDGLTQTFNLESGINETVVTAPSYFEFTSTNVDVARVSELGIVTIVGEGSAEITAQLAGVKALGSLSVQTLGQFTFAPTPTLDPSDVISIFSDAYTNVPVDFYNGFYAPFQTTTSNDFQINGDNILSYENYNFVGIEFNTNVPTIDATEMTVLHMDIFIPNEFDAASSLRINLRDFGADKTFDGGDDSIVFTLITTNSNPSLVSGEWFGVDLDITGLSNRDNLGQIVFDSEGNFTPRPSSFYVDNIYLRK